MFQLKYSFKGRHLSRKELVDFICKSLTELCENIYQWSEYYSYDAIKNDYVHKSIKPVEQALVKKWFDLA